MSLTQVDNENLAMSFWRGERHYLLYHLLTLALSTMDNGAAEIRLLHTPFEASSKLLSATLQTPSSIMVALREYQMVSCPDQYRPAESDGHRDQLEIMYHELLGGFDGKETEVVS